MCLCLFEQNVAQPIFAKIIDYYYLGKKVTIKFRLHLSFSKKTAHSKQTPDMRKIAQSGHPAAD
jgi:hypothetical protein